MLTVTSSRTVSKTKSLEAQLVIIGGGGAGLSAAVAAAEKGIPGVIVLEKRGVPGGNTALATGLFACESPVQEREKIIADRDELFKRAMHWAHWNRTDPRIFRAFLNKSGDTIRWLERKGLEFRVIPFFPNQEPRVWHCPAGKGAQLTRVLAKECGEMGVQILLHTTGKKIRRGAGDNVTGLLAMGEEEFEIKTESVIIATGGFGGNQRLLEKHCPQHYEGMPLRGLPLTGDGLLLASEAGAAIDDSVTLLKEGPRVDANRWPLMGLEREACTLWVNTRGERFIDEAVGFHPFESVNALLRQRGKMCFTLLDSTISQSFIEKTPALEEALRIEADKGRLKISDSWDEIARWIGADPGRMKATIEEYNGFCDHGYDQVFAKDRRYLLPLRRAPFYAIRGLPHFLDTLGGIKIDEQMKVLDDRSSPIVGLYAAGVITSGWQPETYCSDLSGSAFGYAINSGRIAGENAAEFLLSRNTST